MIILNIPTNYNETDVEFHFENELYLLQFLFEQYEFTPYFLDNHENMILSWEVN